MESVDAEASSSIEENVFSLCFPAAADIQCSSSCLSMCRLALCVERRARCILGNTL